jgi:hypothetical protein
MFFREPSPFNPRNPQQLSITGQAKDHRAKGISMRIVTSIRSALFALVVLAMSATAFAQIGISISFAPPELPVYDQPLCPGDGYLWTPGYWAYSGDDYYFVPGTWVVAPEAGLLWTPGYWGWRNNGYFFNEGYWGEHVGFYGGVSYGYGYYGDGYQGGRWEGQHFSYNRSASNVNIVNIHNVYNTTIINNTTTINRVSYNGGNGGIDRRPRPEEEAAARERHVSPVAMQTQHEQTARNNPEQRASVNRGTPQVAATPRAGAFNEAVRAKPTGTPYTPPVRAAVQPPNPPNARPENNTANHDQPVKENRPENRPEPNRPPTPQPNNRPEANRPEANRPSAPQPNDRPEPKRDKPTERTFTPPPSERPQPERTPAPAQAHPEQQRQERPQPAPVRAEDKKPRNEKLQQNEKQKEEKPKDQKPN